MVLHCSCVQKPQILSLGIFVRFFHIMPEQVCPSSRNVVRMVHVVDQGTTEVA
jgi:hypothetical protein